MTGWGFLCDSLTKGLFLSEQGQQCWRSALVSWHTAGTQRHISACSVSRSHVQHTQRLAPAAVLFGFLCSRASFVEQICCQVFICLIGLAPAISALGMLLHGVVILNTMYISILGYSKHKYFLVFSTKSHGKPLKSQGNRVSSPVKVVNK